ncbi:MAG TPA: carboxypeptidase-like regulatory domain-containing protein [Rhodanobacteraceae bacterium]
MKLIAHTRSRLLRTGLVSIALTLAMAGMAQAADNGSIIFGNAGPGQNMSVTVVSTTGVVRTASVDASGNYVISNLPAGVYTVSLSKQGMVINRKRNIKTLPGGGDEVNFQRSGSPVANALKVTD